MCAVTLNACGHRFLPGHRIRLSIATRLLADRLARALRGHAVGAHGESALELPVRRGGERDAVSFEPPAHGPFTPVTVVAPGFSGASPLRIT